MHKVHRDYKNAEQRREGATVERNHTRGNGMLWEGAKIQRIGAIQRIKRRHKA
jgi:hypothetical protein